MDKDLVIISPRGRSRRVQKSREFGATLLGSVEADGVWELGQGSTTRRPVYISYIATAETSRAFTANFRGGMKAGPRSDAHLHDCFEIPKSSPHRWIARKSGGAVITTAFLPELFHLDPPAGHSDVRFIFMPSIRWVQDQGQQLERQFGQEAVDVARAALWTAYLDRRLPLPILQDLRFQLRLYRACLAQEWTFKPGPSRHSGSVLQAEGIESCGLEAPVLCWARPEQLEELLRELMREWCRKFSTAPALVNPIQLPLFDFIVQAA